MLEGTAIVVSPLLALMDDQIQSLTKRGINATTLNSTLGIKAKRKVFEELKTGNVKLLYIAPETILNKEISSFIQDFVNISFIAIDEVHCFKSSTKVETDLGAFTFKELFNLQSNNINLPKAKSFNIEKNIFEYKQIKEVFQNPFSQLQRTWVEGGKIDSTPNHVFFTTEGEKMAKDLKSGDKLISFNKDKIDDFKDWVDTQDLPQVSLVKKTKLLRTIKPDNFLYDMEVEDNHNYFVYTENTNNSLKNKYQNNTLLVHNCLSQWGTGFRPKYAQLYELRKLFPNKCIAGFTATADLVTRNDIINVLQFKNYTEYTHNLDRSSIKYIVYEKRDENLQTLNIIKKYPEDTCGIIYVGTRDKASALQSYLNNRNINCEFFHAGLKVAEKKQIQEDYINGNLNLIICTVAFGMGIDRSNVRYVINVDLPNSLEEFSQMSGRAARDGLESESYLLYGQQDIAKATWLIRQSVKNPDRLKINLDKLKLVVGYAQTNMCRRKKLLEYFGQKIDNCGYCDNCHKNGVYRK